MHKVSRKTKIFISNAIILYLLFYLINWKSWNEAILVIIDHIQKYCGDFVQMSQFRDCQHMAKYICQPSKSVLSVKHFIVSMKIFMKNNVFGHKLNKWVSRTLQIISLHSKQLTWLSHLLLNFGTDSPNIFSLHIGSDKSKLDSDLTSM